MLKSFYPVLMLDKIREQADFFINFFNFDFFIFHSIIIYDN